MIIRFPTALYKPGIPSEPGDGGNVTYVISNTDPPRPNNQTTQLPPAIELRKKSNLPSVDRRDDIGDLFITEVKSESSVAGSSKKQFEIGQVLEFEDSINSDVNPMLVSDTLTIQHDTNLLDLESLDLNDSEIDEITDLATTRMDELKTLLNMYRQVRSDTEIQINENKKTQNETNKALKAVNQLVKIDASLADTVEKLEQKLESLLVEEALLVTQANAAASNATNAVDEIRELAQVVR